jgi:diadenosine tetraphosphate (Ap4A) HIT family hydrolase
MSLSKTLSEEHFQEHCPFCDPAFSASVPLLDETEHFRIICDPYPLREGHLLVIPKHHLSCMGEYSPEVFDEFIGVYESVSAFINKHYGSVSTFEHGKIGQTIFHSHIHVLPFANDPLIIVPEGKDHLVALPSFVELRRLYEQYGRYLFFSIGDLAWVVDPELAVSRFFRDRFAAAIGRPERSNWKEMQAHQEMVAACHEENMRVRVLWKNEVFPPRF